MHINYATSPPDWPLERVATMHGYRLDELKRAVHGRSRAAMQKHLGIVWDETLYVWRWS